MLAALRSSFGVMLIKLFMESEFEGKTENVNRQNITVFRPLIEVKTGLLYASCAIYPNLLPISYLHGF
jgi:hypothetical protein